MYDRYQVLRFENNFKCKDLYLIENEINNRVGTGNYDKKRTKFNIKYKELEKDNLYQDVKYKLESKQKELPEPRETIIDYENTEYYDYDEDLDNKKEDDLVL